MAAMTMLLEGKRERAVSFGTECRSDKGFVFKTGSLRLGKLRDVAEQVGGRDSGTVAE